MRAMKVRRRRMKMMRLNDKFSVQQHDVIIEIEKFIVQINI